MQPCDVRHHQDSDLDKPVDNTHKIYSVCNTPEPLKLKIRSVPCLCPPCISKVGICFNSSYTDPWKTVTLIPEKGAQLVKYKKHKWPDEDVIAANAIQNECSDKNNQVHIQEKSAEENVNPEKDQNEEMSTSQHISYGNKDPANGDGSDEENEEITFLINETEETQHENIASNEENDKNSTEMKNTGACAQVNNNNQHDVTDGVTDTTRSVQVNEKHSAQHTWKNISEEIIVEDFISTSSQKSSENNDIEIIDICERTSKEFEMCSENLLPQINAQLSVTDLFASDISESILWPSVLSALDETKDFEALRKLCQDLKTSMPPLKSRVKSFFLEETDPCDSVM